MEPPVAIYCAYVTFSRIGLDSAPLTRGTVLSATHSAPSETLQDAGLAGLCIGVAVAIWRGFWPTLADNTHYVIFRFTYMNQ